MSNKYQYDQHGWKRAPHRLRHIESSENWFTRIVDFVFKVFLFLVLTGAGMVLGYMLLQIFTR